MSIKIASHSPVEGVAPIKYDGNDLWMIESHKGLVLGTFERNGYDDSDFYATVWNAERGAPEDIEYASTRGWTYANGASVDATPEVIEAYRAWKAARDAEYNANVASLKAAVAVVGSEVVLAGLRKRADLHRSAGVRMIKRCYRCKRAPWTCWGCGAKCCEHLCSLKKTDGTAVCGKCKLVGLPQMCDNDVVGKRGSKSEQA